MIQENDCKGLVSEIISRKPHEITLLQLYTVFLVVDSKNGKEVSTNKAFQDYILDLKKVARGDDGLWMLKGNIAEYDPHTNKVVSKPKKVKVTLKDKIGDAQPTTICCL